MMGATYKNFSVGCDDSGVFRIVLDVPGRALNVLSHDVMEELDRILCELESRHDIKLVVFKSGKESGFLAGADVQSIAAIRTPQEADVLLQQGQKLFQRIESLPFTTIALLHGPCLGGGLELALACDYRVARDNSSTKIGLPEIKLGLIPGWGGTQRLPKRVGLIHALSMILTGKHLSAEQAEAIGLVDRAIHPDQWRDEIETIVHTLARRRALPQRQPIARRFRNWLLSLSPIRNKILDTSIKRVASKSKAYPALAGAVRAIAASFDDSVQGYEIERSEFCRLIDGDTSRNLLNLFLSREKARNTKTWCPESEKCIHQTPIRNLGIVGGGVMGAGIAQIGAVRGFKVQIKEVDDQSAHAGLKRINQSVMKYCHHKRYDDDKAREILSQISISTDPTLLNDSDCVIEAVVENLDIKCSVLAEVESHLPKNAILATNTSALSVTRMGQALSLPSRFAGLHFFNPVPRMELVEVVKGRETSDVTISKLVSFVKALGKTPIVTSDSPGFLVNRILFPYLGEALLMLREGREMAEIDREMRSFGMPMGPLELLDRVGLDVAKHVAESLRTILPAVDDVLEVLEPLVQREQLGTKTDIGFYDYRGKHARNRDVNEVVDFLVDPSEPVDMLRDGLSDIQRRLVYPMIAEAIRCQQECVVKHLWAIDLAMVLGTGFAPHHGGPLSLMDSIGHEVISQNMSRKARQFGDRFIMPESLSTGAEQ